MLRQECFDRVADGESSFVVGRSSGSAGVGGVTLSRLAARLLPRAGRDRLRAVFGREELGVDLWLTLLQPRFGLRGIRELSGDPGRRLVDAGFLNLLAFGAPLPIGVGGLFGLSGHLVGELDVRRDLPLAERPLDGLEHHRVGVVGRDDEDRLALREDAHPFSLKARLVPDERARRRHDVLD